MPARSDILIKKATLLSISHISFIDITKTISFLFLIENHCQPVFPAYYLKKVFITIQINQRIAFET